MQETYILTCLMMNYLRLSGPYARLLLLQIMGRISHFTLWNLLMKILNVLPLEMTQELLGCTFLMDTQEDGQRFRARIVECISDHESNVHRSDDHVYELHCDTLAFQSET
jgi:hypothetical protein